MMSGRRGLNFNIMSGLVENNTAHIARCFGCGDLDSVRALPCLRGLLFEKLMNDSVVFSRESRPPFGKDSLALGLTSMPDLQR